MLELILILAGLFGSGSLLAGTDQDDELIGDDRPNGATGDEGDDVIKGLGGADVLLGGEGDDLLRGNQGYDYLDGGPGDDRLHGGRGFDQLHGAEGDDFLEGLFGKDFLDGGAGDDTLLGGSWHDTLEGGEGYDRLIGGPGNDLIMDETYEPFLRDEGTATGTVAETVEGGDGNDTIQASSTTLIADGGTGNDAISGGGGTVDVNGGEGNDTIQVGAFDGVVRGGAGADVIESSIGDGVIRGGQGYDRISMSSGGDQSTSIFGDRGYDYIDITSRDFDGGFLSADGGSGNDFFDLQGEVDVRGDSGKDTFRIGGPDILGAVPSIYDFDPTQDTLILDGFGVTGPLSDLDGNDLRPENLRFQLIDNGSGDPVTLLQVIDSGGQPQTIARLFNFDGEGLDANDILITGSFNPSFESPEEDFAAWTDETGWELVGLDSTAQIAS